LEVNSRVTADAALIGSKLLPMRGVQILRIGVLVFACALLVSHLTLAPVAVSSFLSGCGVALVLVGVAKPFTELKLAPWQ